MNSMIRMLNTFINEFYDEAFLSQDIKIRHSVIDSYFVMCAIWGLGGSVTTECRKPFDMHARGFARTRSQVMVCVCTRARDFEILVNILDLLILLARGCARAMICASARA